MAHPQCGLPEASSSQSDPPLVAPHFPQNYLGLNEGDLIFSLTRLHLHKSSQASNEVSFPDFSALFCNIHHLHRIN